jgi:hypothetical protein
MEKGEEKRGLVASFIPRRERARKTDFSMNPCTWAQGAGYLCHYICKNKQEYPSRFTGAHHLFILGSVEN